jgi:hypothetical protein
MCTRLPVLAVPPQKSAAETSPSAEAITTAD